MSAAAELRDAVAHEAEAYRLMLAGRPAQPELVAARDAYLRSHDQVHVGRSFGRLLGALKLAILAGDGVEPIAVRAIAETREARSETAAYLAALARTALYQTPLTERLQQEPGPLALSGAALDALTTVDGKRYARALWALLADFEVRDAFVTGVRFADTAAVLEQLAEQRGIAVRPTSDILPPPEGL